MMELCQYDVASPREISAQEHEKFSLANLVARTGVGPVRNENIHTALAHNLSHLPSEEASIDRGPAVLPSGVCFPGEESVAVLAQGTIGDWLTLTSDQVSEWEGSLGRSGSSL